MELLLAGDIGGTSTRLHLAPIDNWRDHRWEATYPSPEFTDLVPIVQKFLADAQAQGNVITACFAVAGPIVQQTASLPNLNWFLAADRLSAELGIPHVRLINDFTAVGHGIEHLQPQEIHILQAGQPQPQAPRAIIGAGTGLGQGYLVPMGDTYQVYASEGGHSDFAARTAQEFQLIEYLMRRDQLDHVSGDRLISGRGIVNIYQFLRDSRTSGDPQQPSNELPAIAEAIAQWVSAPTADYARLTDPAMLIAQAAQIQANALAVNTMQLFLSLYGAEAGNLALKLLPYGGLYLAGGIAAKNLSLMTNGTFLQAFCQKGRVSALLPQIPVYLILNTQVGLLGAAGQAISLLKNS